MTMSQCMMPSCGSGQFFLCDDDALFITSCNDDEIWRWNLMVDAQGENCLGYITQGVAKLYWFHWQQFGQGSKIVE